MSLLIITAKIIVIMMIIIIIVFIIYRSLYLVSYIPIFRCRYVAISRYMQIYIDVRIYI